jgi:hypothetical protein
MGQSARIAGFAVALLGFTAAAGAGEPVRLTGAQLDGVNAGKAVLKATASGTGEAHGEQAAATVNTSSLLAPGPPGATLTVGQVVSTASSPAGGVPATASSALSLSLTVP